MRHLAKVVTGVRLSPRAPAPKTTSGTSPACKADASRLRWFESNLRHFYTCVGQLDRPPRYERGLVEVRILSRVLLSPSATDSHSPSEGESVLVRVQPGRLCRGHGAMVIARQPHKLELGRVRIPPPLPLSPLAGGYGPAPSKRMDVSSTLTERSLR